MCFLWGVLITGSGLKWTRQNPTEINPSNFVLKQIKNGLKQNTEYLKLWMTSPLNCSFFASLLHGEELSILCEVLSSLVLFSDFNYFLDQSLKHFAMFAMVNV